MVNSQEVIERSIYSAILNTSVALGYSINPEEYLPVSEANSRKYAEAKKNLKKFVGIFGTGNNQSKDMKVTPRIVVNARGFYPGNIGLPKQLISKGEGIGYTATEVPYSTIDQYIDIHLVANNQEDLRLLHQITFYSIPQRGYLKPYDQDKFLFSGNIFLELVNFFDTPNLEVGIMEKIYQFVVEDTLAYENTEPLDWVPITDISAVIEAYDGSFSNTLNINNQN